jgi:hypothetical protein
MLGADVFVAKTLGFMACQLQQLPCRLGELKVAMMQCLLPRLSVWRRLTLSSTDLRIGLFSLRRPFQTSQPSCFAEKGQAFIAGHGFGLLRRDAFNFGTVSGFTVAGITSDHAVLVQEMQVSFSGHRVAEITNGTPHKRVRSSKCSAGTGVGRTTVPLHPLYAHHGNVTPAPWSPVH